MEMRIILLLRVSGLRAETPHCTVRDQLAIPGPMTYRRIEMLHLRLYPSLRLNYCRC